MSIDVFREFAVRGFTMRIPAAMGSGASRLWSKGAADSLVGTFTEFNAREFEIEETWRMKVVAAEVVDDGAAIVLTLRQPTLEDIDG